jgi:hypothetical protein
MGYTEEYNKVSFMSLPLQSNQQPQYGAPHYTSSFHEDKQNLGREYGYGLIGNLLRSLKLQ